MTIYRLPETLGSPEFEGVREGNRNSTSEPVSSRRDSKRDSRRDSGVSPSVPTRPEIIPPPPLAKASTLAGLGLTEREIEKTEEAITLAMPNVRNMAATIRTLIANGDIATYVDQARVFIAEDVPRARGRIPDHPWNPDRYGVACQQCPLPENHAAHQEAS